VGLNGPAPYHRVRHANPRIVEHQWCESICDIVVGEEQPIAAAAKRCSGGTRKRSRDRVLAMPLVDLHLPRTGACPKRSLLSSVNSNSRKSSTNAYLKRALSQSARRGAEAPGAATSAASSLPPISWPEYLAIRKSRKRWETVRRIARFELNTALNE
jgi:hypothetical protein